MCLHSTIEAIPKSAIPHYRDTAKAVIAMFGNGEDAVAACLAQISGKTEFNTRSLINAKKDVQTMLVSLNQGIRTASFVYVVVRACGHVS